ncbi:MAG: hypothetical protein M1837_005104 [Sclerophora amabilis]|nr:MAG: hypothetical protein M1837_005104 [Sclerophora amabilis]
MAVKSRKSSAPLQRPSSSLSQRLDGHDGTTVASIDRVLEPLRNTCPVFVSREPESLACGRRLDPSFQRPPIPKGNSARPSPPPNHGEMRLNHVRKTSESYTFDLDPDGGGSPSNVSTDAPTTQASGSPPSLFHRVRHNSSILALAVSDYRVFAGSQEGEISVWSLDTFELFTTVKAHRRSVLCLSLSPDKQLLFSSAGDAIVNVWCTNKLERVYSIYSTYDVGDVFSVAYSANLHTVYLGAQNTSIQWYDLKEKDTRQPPNPISHPFHRNHRFFDSKGPGGVSTPRPVEEAVFRASGGQDLEIDNEHILQYAHYGYVYCMLLTRGLGSNGPDEEMLISGGGDGTIKLWNLDSTQSGAISETAVLENGDNSVLSLALNGSFLYSGLLEGDINVWDLETMQLVRSVKAHAEDVLTVSIGGGFIFSGGASGHSKKFNQRHECLARWPSHDGLILASAVTNFHGRHMYITGGNDNCVTFWDVSVCEPEAGSVSKISNEQLLGSLAKLVSYKTVSSKRRCIEDCRRGATYLRSLFKSFGAATEMLNTDTNLNPIVFARFKGKRTRSSKRKKILFYGHYDVIAAEGEKKWITDPFDMKGIDGYLYGRGVSDNKGPVLAALYGAADLVAEQALELDIIFLIEGEEESGSRGFEKAVKENKELIGDVDWILVANSYWLDDEVPCLTYGLRGVIHASIQVQSDHPNLHSGVDGSSLMDEPLKDLVMVTGRLTGSRGRVEIPNFYDPVLPVTHAEQERYVAITDTLLRHNPALAEPKTLTESLMHRWREPSLTIHRFNVSGPEDNRTIIPHLARVALSIRLVPNQEMSKIKVSLISFVESTFASLGSDNHLTITIDHEADPWLGDPDNEIFQTLERAVMDAWGPIGEGGNESSASVGNSVASSPELPSSSTSTSISNLTNHTQDGPPSQQSPQPRKPLYIREGGSIPSIRFLEKEFSAPAAHLPCGQASDSAHLDNERLRLSNLYKSREIFGRVFRELGHK